MLTLFGNQDYEPTRDTTGRYCTRSIAVQFANMRKTIVAEIRRKESVSRQLRQKDEEIIALKAEIKRLKQISL